MNIAYISLILSFLTNVGLMYIILRLVRGQLGSNRAHTNMYSVDAHQTETVKKDIPPAHSEVFTTIPQVDTPHAISDVVASETKGESLVHLFDNYDTSYLKPKAENSTWFNAISKYTPSRGLVALALFAVVGIALLGIIKKLIPGVSQLISEVWKKIDMRFDAISGFEIEPLMISSVLLSVLALSLLVHAIRSGKRTLRIGSFMLLLGSMIYGSYALPTILLAYVLVSIVTIVAVLFAAHRGSYKKLWLTFIAGVLSFATIFVHFTGSVSDNMHSLYLFLLLITVFGVSLHIAQKQVPFDAEDAFFVASGPIALGFLTQGVAMKSYSYIIGIYLVLSACIFAALLYYSRSIVDKYKNMATIAVGGVMITGAYSLVPSAWYNLIIALLALALLYFTATRGRLSAYVIYIVGFLAVLRLLIVHGSEGSSTYFANTGFVTHVLASLLVLFLSGVLYQNSKRLPYFALNRFSIFAGVLIANLIFSIGTLSEFARMKDHHIISPNDYALLSLIGLVLHGVILIAVSMYRKTRGILSIGTLFVLGGFAKFYILDMQEVSHDIFSLVTLAAVSLIILLTVLFPDYKKYLPK